jgi:hypothetical protein
MEEEALSSPTSRDPLAPILGAVTEQATVQILRRTEVDRVALDVAPVFKPVQPALAMAGDQVVEAPVG